MGKTASVSDKFAMPEFTWASVNVGIFRTIDDLEYALSQLPIGRSWSSNLPFKIQPFKRLELVTVRPSVYGKRENMSRYEICQLGREMGLEECPQEVGPQLIIQGKVESGIEEVSIASTEPLGDRKDAVLTISQRLGPLWLNCYVDPENGYSPATVWVFVKPKK